MKILFALLFASLSLNALAGVTNCSGMKDGKDVTFTIATDETKRVKSMEVSVDGALVSKKLTEIRSNSIAGGTMITASEPWAIAINDVSIFIDDTRGCFNGDEKDSSKDCILGWVNLFQEGIVIRGIPLICE